MKYCVLFFFEVMAVMWWTILSAAIAVDALGVKNGYMALLALFMMTVGSSLSITVIYWNSKD